MVCSVSCVNISDFDGAVVIKLGVLYILRGKRRLKPKPAFVWSIIKIQRGIAGHHLQSRGYDYIMIMLLYCCHSGYEDLTFSTGLTQQRCVEFQARFHWRGKRSVMRSGLFQTDGLPPCTRQAGFLIGGYRVDKS